MPNIYFDDSLPKLLSVLHGEFSSTAIEMGAVLRDASGRLSFFSHLPAESDAERERLSELLSNALGAYARPGRSIVFAGDSGSKQMLESPGKIPIQVGEKFCWLIDRRIVGSGWLESPAALKRSPPRIAFATLKGGVGRTTALVVAATDLARRNKNVLLIDLDLEAPGLSDTVLGESRLPEFGVIDFLVENGLSELTDSQLSAFIGTSELTAAGGGRVDVVPALGRRSVANPENVLPKLSRAMIEDVTDAGSVSVGQQISQLIDRMSELNGYDVILIDSRAGLAELAAPAVIGLGATVLLFGTSQKQTIEGYRALFSGLQLLAQRDLAGGRSADWRLSIKPVYAKAGLGKESGDRFLDDFYELFSEHLYDAEAGESGSRELVRFTRDDSSAPHWPLTIAFNQSFVDFDPARVAGQLTQSFYEQTFRPFLSGLDELINSKENGSLG
jgi:Mrp family chromosome partitioning ATPase